MITIDKLAYSSRLRFKSPVLKASLSVGALLISTAARSFIISAIVLAVMGGLAVFGSRTSPKRYIKLMSVPLVFFILSTVAIIINISTAKADLFNLAVGSFYISVSKASLFYASQLIITALSAVSCLYFLALTTPIIDLLTVLRRLGCPWIVIELMLLIYRFIFVVLDMAVSILTAQKCRLGNKDFKTSMQGMGQMLAVLLVRALKKSSYLYDAMESRLYDGKINVLDETYKANATEKAAAILFLAGIAVLAVVLNSGGF